MEAPSCSRSSGCSTKAAPSGGCCSTKAAPSATMESQTIQDDVKEYYGKTRQSRDDLPKVITPEVQQMVHSDVTKKYYGCGLVIPTKLEGASVLDLGSGAGQDCFVLSKMVGQNGHVTGVDMTDEQLEVARKYIPYHTEKFGYQTPNVTFVKGYLEKLDEAGMKTDTFDVIVSNCVINLCPDKRSVLQETYRVLKEGGEMYFSDIYCDRDLPDDTRKHKLLWGECRSGALWWRDLYTIAKEIGFSPPRLVTVGAVKADDPKRKAVLGDAKFVSVTYRLFKLPQQRAPPVHATYKGGILGSESTFVLDHSTAFPIDVPVPVDTEAAAILKSSRFKDNFTFREMTKSELQTSPTDKQMPDPFVLAGTMEAPSCSRSSGCSTKAAPSGGCCKKH